MDARGGPRFILAEKIEGYDRAEYADAGLISSR